jgi:hypothetical protein
MKVLSLATILTVGIVSTATAQVYNPYSGYGPGPGYPGARSQSIGGPEDAGMTELHSEPRRSQNYQVPQSCVERTICVEDRCKRARICP